MSVELIIGLIAAVAGMGGWAAMLRARSQNELDSAKAGEANATADSTNVETAEKVVAFVNREMDRLREDTARQVNELREQVANLRGQLERVEQERDRLRDSEEAFRRELASQVRENAGLRERIGALEGQIAALTTVEVKVTPADVQPGGRRATDPPETTT